MSSNLGFSARELRRFGCRVWWCWSCAMEQGLNRLMDELIQERICWRVNAKPEAAVRICATR